jgi:4-hydroxy-3-methylbut-2-enyl diphosphate reductase
MGWCFGVRDAVALVEREAATGPVTVLGELVHNETVNAELRQRGVRIVGSGSASAAAEAVGDGGTGSRSATIIITAHGASEKMIEHVRQQAPRVVEATCPLVRSAHQAVCELAVAGYYPVIVGQRDHVEVRGLIGDLAEFSVVLAVDDVRLLPSRCRYGVVAQTTQPLDRVRQLVELIRQRFPEAEVRLVDTVCLPTKQRQAAAVELARQCDVVVVIGGRHSNNTRELAATCAQHCLRVERVETAADLQWSWFHSDDTVGITAGTSTPDSVIAVVEHWLRELAEEFAKGGANVLPATVPSLSR